MASVGDYFRCRCLPTSVRVKAYSEPPGGAGHYLTTLAPGTYFGPVEMVIQNHGFITVLVRGYWMNVGKFDGDDPMGRYVSFAFVVSPRDVRSWEKFGWQHQLHQLQ